MDNKNYLKAYHDLKFRLNLLNEENVHGVGKWPH